MLANDHVSELSARALRASGLLRVRVAGDSMAPTLRRGDVLVVQWVSPAELRRGDLLVMRLASGLLTHRLVAWQGRQLVTRGDQCGRADAPQDPSRLLGRVVRVERGPHAYDLLVRRARLASWLAALPGWLGLRLGRWFGPLEILAGVGTRGLVALLPSPRMRGD